MEQLDQAQLRRACERAAERTDADDFFSAETRERLLERLALMRLEPSSILDLGGGAGQATAALKTLYPSAQIINLDWSPNALRRASSPARVCGNALQLPFIDDSVDLVIANLLLPGSAAPAQVFAEAQRVLRTPGLFLFNTVGPDTLKEVRRAWSGVDRMPHVHDFADMHNIGDALVQAGFREPVMDVEKITINYRKVARLAADLRVLAATNRHPGRARGLMSRARWNAFLEATDSRRDAAGRLPVSAELVTGQAWTAAPGRGVSMEDGVAQFPIAQLRRGR
jgi:malonyl-CoA O-methyltransferase